MSVTMISRNYNTGYCEFGYDNWSDDGDSLPRIGTSGKNELKHIKGCSQNSIAIGTDGTCKILKGKTNKWVDFKSANLGSSLDISSGIQITENEIEDIILGKDVSIDEEYSYNEISTNDIDELFAYQY